MSKRQVVVRRVLTDILYYYMHIFVYEHITGGGMLNESLRVALANEGDLMLQAVVRDLLEVPGVEVITIRDARLANFNLPVDVRLVSEQDDFSVIWSNCIQAADAVWPIAPETDGVLERISTSIIASGKQLLNSSPGAVRLAASKSSTIRCLESFGLPVVPTYGPMYGHMYSVAERPPCTDGEWVIKPDDGAGCIDVRLFASWDEACCELQSEPDSCVIQPYVAGVAASLSLLCAAGEARLLSVNRQRIEVSEQIFRLVGCEVNELSHYTNVGAELAAGVARAVPGLWGYVGVDLIYGELGALIVEINPRVTTSYAGLRQSLNINPAELILDSSQGSLPTLLPHMTRTYVNLDVCG